MSIHELQEYTRIARYARYNEEKGRRETWVEQVNRVMDMHEERYAKYMDSIEDEMAIAYNALKKKLVLGSQRALQFGGPSIIRKNARMYNCLDVDTQFITSNGVKSFNDFTDGDITTVLTHEGNWKSATVKNYGIDKLDKIILKKGKSKLNTVYATSDHTWLLKDGTRTESLKEGDQLIRQPSIFKDFDWDNAEPMERLYWCYGLVYGDGTRIKDSNGEYKHSLIRLCGDDAKFAYRFEEMGFVTSTHNSINGDMFAYTGKYLKTTPDLDIDSPSLIKAFVRGFLDADGEKNSNISKGTGSLFVNIQQSNKEAQEFIRTAFPMAGVYITSETQVTRNTNYGKHDAIKFFISDCMEGSSPIWKVDKITPSVKEENVWCLEVEDDHSFVMPNGIVTGNCTVSYADRARFFQESMYLLLCGCGVGFSVQTHHVAKLPSLVLPSLDAETVVYQIPDSIEGWSDAIGVLLSSYFSTEQTMPEYFGKKIEFDYSLIRPEGALIADTNGKAPGPEPLKKAMGLISDVITRASAEDASVSDEFRLRTLDVYDIVMHSSDAVLAGGVRRSATICMFSHDDELMITAKTGDWFISNPQRGRSNNSAMLIRDETSREEFNKLMASVREFGEPGFVWADDKEALYNPCVEIGMRAYDEQGRSGWSFCNLCEINVKKAKTAEDFYEMCKAAAILGTMQAGYARFEYLGEVTQNIVKREALLGCSMTGMMDNPDISFDPEIQRKGAQLIIETNEAFCKKIDVNPAARTTCVKPAGSTSCILGTASGIHPHHAKRYFRRVQVNKLEEPLTFFRAYNPDAIGESVWSANNSDDFITFLCEVPKNARTKVDVDAIQLLDFVKSTQQNWVEYGTNHKHCVAPWLRHNVSNTINVRDHEWDIVADYIYDNRQFFAGISLLPMSGDKDYAQAPFQTVYTPKELVDMYGDASVFASGLIIHALKAFNGNLYRACDTVLGFGESIKTTIKLEREIDLTHSTDQDISDMKEQIGTEMSKLKWLARAKKFADNYFEGDLRQMTYCLKDTDAWKTWVDLKRVYKPVPWDEFYEGGDNTKVSETVACAGNSCEIKTL